MFYGNIEKYRISRELLACASNAKILDFGAGNGSDWPFFMAKRPDVQFYFFEPSARSAGILRRRMQGTNAIVLNRMSDCPIGIDYIVSFSVFEHVFDRVGYLAECSRVLAGDGRIFLNYDDGHFRFNFAINQGVPILQNLMQGREVISNLIRPVAARAWLVRFYQARVTEAIIDKLVRRADLRIVSKRFANLVSMKRLAKMIEANSVEAFHETWLRLEDELNHAVTFCPSSAMGHKDARWLEMPSCTLILGKK